MDVNAQIAALAPADEGYAVIIAENWSQGRTTFGGISAAICVEAAMGAFTDLAPLRSAQFAFIGPAFGHVRAASTLLRRGRSAVFVGVDLIGQDGLALRASLCFAAARPLPRAHMDLPAPTTPAPANCQPAFPAGRGPSFLQNFDVLDAGFDRTKPERLLWLRHRAAITPNSIAALVALADAPPPSALNVISSRAVATMTWTLDILTDDFASADGWFLIRNTADTIDAGYSSQGSVLWNSAGAPVLVARQNIAVFA